MIDVSQSVEHDHPMALDFLRRDCAVLNDFFKKNKVFVLTTLKLFNFITNITIQKDEIELTLGKLL
jgi:RIO kinase 1